MRALKLASASLVLFTLGAFGCTTTLAGRFEPAGRVVDTPIAAHIVIEMGADQRPLQGRTSLRGGFLALIPFIPYGTQKFSPEYFWRGYSIHVNGFRGDVEETVSADLVASGLVSKVGPFRLAPGQPTPVGTDALTLHIGLQEGIYTRHFTSYGVSILSTFLWLAGFPVSYGSSEIAFDVELRDAAGNTLGRDQFEASRDVIEWIYYAVPYQVGMADAYADISPKLREFVRRAAAKPRS